MWYWPPARLAKMYRGSSRCWRCDTNSTGFWQQIQIQIYYIANIRLSLSPKVFLLNIIDFRKHKKLFSYNYKLIIFLLAAPLVIALYWKKSMMPTLAEWCAKIWNLMLMHKLKAIVE